MMAKACLHVTYRYPSGLTPRVFETMDMALPLHPSHVPTCTYRTLKRARLTGLT